jgi:hypothetical protein
VMSGQIGAFTVSLITEPVGCSHASSTQNCDVGRKVRRIHVVYDLARCRR